MNEHQRRLMNAPRCEATHDGVLICCICGTRAHSRHHVVPRSQGGADGPTMSLCGTDNVTGCHGEVHQHRAFVDYRDGRWVNCYVSDPEWRRAGVPVGRRAYENIPDHVGWYACLDGDL